MFSYKLLLILIIRQDLSFGSIALKIEFVVFVYELINYEIIFFITWLCNYYYYQFFQRRVTQKALTFENGNYA